MSKKQEYESFAALSRSEREGTNFKIHVTPKKSPVAVIAPHGGGIEPSTDRIAAAIAGDDFNLYCFEALKAANPAKILHITSDRFDEPRCEMLITGCDTVVAVHGLKDKVTESVDVGGLDNSLRDAVCQSLTKAGFVAKAVSSGSHAGISVRNICNRGRANKGVQLEITRALRDKLKDDSLLRFAEAIRSAITAHSVKPTAP